MLYETKEMKVKTKIVMIKKPKLSKDVRMTSKSNRGQMPNLKEKGTIIHFQSFLEHDFYLILVHDPHCIEIVHQPRLGWTYTPYGKNEPVEFFPDVWAVFSDGTVYIFEVKTDKALKNLTAPFDKSKLESEDKEERDSHRQRYNWHLKLKSINKNCRKYNYIYQVVTNKQIKCQRMDNIKDLIQAAKHWHIDRIRLFDPEFVMPSKLFSNIRKILDVDPNLTISELAELLVSTYNNQYQFDTIVSLLMYHIYFLNIMIDWDIPFSESTLSINNNETPLEKILVPTYNLTENPVDGEYKCNEQIQKEELHYDEKTITLLIAELQKLGRLSDKNYTKEEIFYKLHKETNKTLKPAFRNLSKSLKNKTIRDISSDFGKWKKEYKKEQDERLIEPLIKLFNINDQTTKQEIYNYCLSRGKFQSTGLGFSKSQTNRAYRKFLKWKKRNIYGIEPDREKKDRKSKFSERVQNLLAEYSHTWNKKMGFMKKYHEEMKIRLMYPDELELTNGIQPLPEEEVPCYHTFRNYCHSIANKEIFGKYDSGVENEIKRGLFSFYKEGRYPGSVILIDHTTLDIWVVNYADKKAYIRPWVTLAIDAYSGAIWGVHISDRYPNQENNIKCLLTGILDKSSIFSEEWSYVTRYGAKNGIDLTNYQWVVNGLPARIQVDNGKDFDSNFMKEFCSSLGITFEFRPVKQPEYGGIVESAWDTINDELRNRAHEFGGVVFPLPKENKKKSRINWKSPKNYDPKKTAKMTLDMIKEWLIGYIVIKFNRTPHSGQSHSPNQLWKDSLAGNFPRPLGGGLLTLSPNRLTNGVIKGIEVDKSTSNINSFFNYWEIKTTPIISEGSGTRIISERGVRARNFLYTSDLFRSTRIKGTFNGKPFVDGQDVTVRQSKEDMRYIWIEHNGGFMKLRAYKYTKDIAVWNMVEKGIKQNYKITKRNVDLMRKLLEERKNDDDHFDSSEYSILQTIVEEFAQTGKLNLEQRRYLEDNYPKRTIGNIFSELMKEFKDERALLKERLLEYEEDNKTSNDTVANQDEDETSDVIILDDFENIYEDEEEYDLSREDMNANRMEA